LCQSRRFDAGLITAFLLPGWQVCIITKIRNSPQSTHTTGFQNQRGLIQWLASPAHGKCAEDVAVRNNQDVPLRLVGMLEAGAVIFLLDLGDQGIKTADDIFG
jgi:hypothetical protein